MRFRWTLVFAVLVLCVTHSHAETILLKNGDRVSGDVVKEDLQYITIETELLGLVNINQDFVDKKVSADELKVLEEQKIAEAVAAYQEEVEQAKVAALAEAETEEPELSPWSRKLSAGYQTTNGNTKTSAATLMMDVNRKADGTEWIIKGDLYYASDKGRMTAQKSSGIVRYNFDDAKNDKWFNFYKMQIDHDRFANIDYRLVPSAGRGYHFIRGDDMNLLAEAALAYQYTDYRDETKANGEMILIPRIYGDKTFKNGLKVLQEFIMYPSFEDIKQYRFRSETAASQPINDHLSWKISFIDEYNSEPGGSTKKNDTRFISAVDVSF